MSIPIGQHLRNVRKNQALTLKNLSEKTGLSIGYLSNIERDIVSPTIAVLSDICRALDVELTAFLQPLSPKTPVLKKSERETVYRSGSSRVRYESISPNGFRLKGLCITLYPGGSSGSPHADADNATPHSHSSDEIGIVTQGKMELIIDETPYILEEGDAFSIESGVPHWYKNIGESVCVFYAVTA